MNGTLKLINKFGLINKVLYKKIQSVMCTNGTSEIKLIYTWKKNKVST